MTGGGGSAEAVAARINQEQLFHELEQKYLLLKADYAVLEQERDGVVEQKSDVVAKLKQLQETVVERESEVVKAKEELLKLRTERDQLVFQVKTATSLADRRLNEVEDLQQTVKEQSKQLVESQRKEVEALQRAAEQETLVEPLRHNVNRLNKELEANKQHLEWMEKQLTEKTKLIQELRQTAAKATHDHEDLQVRHADEVASLRKQLESARQISKKLESSLVQAKEQMEEVQASRVHEEERLHNELSAQRRLADLYKESAEDANTRVNELQELCETLRRSLAESEDALAHQETRTKEKVEHIFREQAAASEQRIEALQDELKEAQSRLEELQRNKLYSLQTVSAVSELSTSAGAAHLAAHGLSPKELCDQILVLETALRAERDEKEQLKICMDRVVKEVHEKAPMLMGLKLDLERSVASNAQVSERLESCMQELVKCRARERQALVDKQSFERKCEALAKSVDDLSRQVQHLLFRAHENHANASIGESASENLVVFKDVEELQVRNQQLLMVIRELTDAKKKTRSADFGTDATGSAHLILSGESDVESDGEGESASETGKRLSVALKEIEDLRAEREEERQMIAAIVKQRDMYRILLAQADSKFSESSGAAASTRSASTESPAETGHPSRSSSADLTDSRALRELQNEFDTYKKEKQANMKMIQDALDQARSEATNFRLSQMQAEVEAKCSKDRLEASEKRRQDADEEVIRLRAKLDQVNTLLLQHQKLLANNEARLEAATTRLRSLEVEKDGALREVAFMKKNEEKVLHELTSLRLDNTNLLKLMDSSRQIESSREERERRESERLAQKLATLETKLQETYDKMESNEAVAGAKIGAEEQAKKIALAELNNAKEQLSEAREKLARVEEQAHAATTKCSLHEKEASLLREQLRKGASAAVAERVSALEVQLRQSQQEVQSSVEMKKSLTEAVAKYKAIAEANEKTLSELSAASEKWKAEMAEKLMAVEAERNAIQTELDRARAQIKQDVSEGNKLREEFDAMVMKHQSALKESQAKQRQLQIEADAARSELAALQEEASNLREDVASAQENYERELKLHASQVEKYSASRKQLQDEQKKSRALQGEVAELKTRISVAENEVAEKISSLEKLLKDSNLSQSSLTEQNKLLHTQLERANQQLRQAHESELRRTIEAPNGAVSLSSQQDHAKELEDLRSVISYLRKESEVLSSKHDLARQENLRYRTQITMLESTVERLRDEMKRVEESSASAVHEAASVAAKENAKLEQLDLLRESNATLREECQKSLARVKAEEERVKNLEAQLGPLRNSESLLKAQIDSLKEEIIALTDANKRWKQRVEQLVEKYQQVDPAEYEKVCAEKASLTKELAELKTAEQTLRAELETLKSSEGKTVEEEKSKAENLRKQYDRIKGFAKTWKAKAEGLTKQVTEKTKEADDKAALVAELEKKLSQCNTDKSALEAKLASVESAKSDEAGVNASWEKERQEMKDKADAEAKRVVTLREMNSKLLNGLKTLKQENSQLKLQLSATATQSVPDNTTTTTSIPGNDAPKLPASSVSEPSAPLAPSSSVSQPKPDEPKEPVIPAKSPVRSPSQPPAAVPTLKTVTSSAPVVSSVIPSPATSAVPAQVPAAAVEAKPEVVAPTPAAAATAPAPSSEPTSTTTSVPTTTPATAAAAPPVSAEEKLRLFALQSMKKQFQKVGGDSGAKPTGLTPAKPMQPPVVAPAAAKLPLPSVGANVTGEEEKPSASSGPFLKLSPPSGTFGAFGSGGASGLVFGKPGITLPIPASPTPVTTLAAATSNTATTITTNFNVTSSATSNASQTTTESTTTTVVSGETEAQRRSQRLARFAAASASTAEVSATLKRPATAAPETTAATPQKIAKLSGSATSAPVADSQETEEEFPSQACADDSEATEDEPTQAPSPSPLPQTEPLVCLLMEEHP